MVLIYVKEYESLSAADNGVVRAAGMEFGFTVMFVHCISTYSEFSNIFTILEYVISCLMIFICFNTVC